ncbi:MAG: hypothetical protein CVV49_08820 [Spirochaetae bacterium HGW-Spirochaetae-5]|nr:MAG: hypothetical protein CVV49_08820 [Spirochaetae bacterium HGW-Spirochaetae-5]
MADQKVLFEIYLENGEFKTRAKESSDALGKIGDKAQKSESAFSKLKSSWMATTAVALSVVYAFTKVGQVLGECIEYASKLQETQNKFDVVFKNSRTQAMAFAKTLVESYGLATEEAMAFLAGTGDILTGLGMQSDKALDLSNSVAQLGIDLASLSNVEGGAERAIAALTSALTGEREALKAYGIVVSEEMIKAELQARNKSNLTGLSLQQAKAEATLAIAYAQSGNAIGDMARSFDSYANIQRRIDSRIKDFKAGIGEDLLPAMSNLGLAFLSASKDGGIFASMLKGLVKFIGDTINSIALLIAYLNKNSITKENEKIMEHNRKLRAAYEKNKTLVQETQEKAKKGDQEAIANLERMTLLLAIQKKDLQERYKNTATALESETEANNAVLKIQESMLKTEKEINAEINKRNKEKKDNPLPTSSGGSTGVKENKAEQEDPFNIGSYGVSVTSVVSGFNSELSQLYAMNTANHNAEIDNRTQKQLEAISETYEAEKLAIENSVLSTEEKNAKLKALDEKRARDEKSVIDKAEKEKRKLARESAEMQKKLAIADVLINTPAAALQTFRAIVQPSMPWTVPLAYSAAIGTTALGMAKLKLIKEQPLPSYAVGTWAVPRDMTAQIHKDEMIVPKTFSDSVRRGEATIGGSGGATVNIYVEGAIVDREGFARALVDAGMDIERSTGLKMFTRK